MQHAHSPQHAPLSPGATRLAPSIQEGGRGARGRKGGAGGVALQHESACTRIKKKVARGSGTRLQGSRAGRTSPFSPLSGPTYIYICIRGAKHERTVPLYTPPPRAPVPGAIVLQDLDREIYLRNGIMAHSQGGRVPNAARTDSPK